MAKRVLVSGRGESISVIFSYTTSNRKATYRLNIVQPVKWSEISWRNRSRDAISGGFGMMLWDSDNKCIGGFYKIFHQDYRGCLRRCDTMWFWVISLKQQQECVGGLMYSKIMSQKLYEKDTNVTQQVMWIIFNKLAFTWRNSDVLTLFSKLVQ